MSELQLPLTGAGAAVDLEIVDGEFVASPPVDSLSALSPSPPPIPLPLEARNLFGARPSGSAARAASASTRRQYGATFRAFGDWLAGELGRPPLVGDVDADVIAAYGRQLAACGGRGGGSAAPVTVRVYLLLRREVTGADTERD